MFWKHSVPAALLAVLVLLPTPGSAADALAAFQARAARFHTVVSIPEFETTPEAVKATADKTIAAGNAALDSIGQLHPSEVNFHNTIRALDDVNYLLQGASDRLSLMQPCARLRPRRSSGCLSGPWARIIARMFTRR